MGLKYYVIDLESSGLKASWHEINQLSIIRVDDKFQKTFNIAVANPWRASQEALNVQNKTKEDLKIGISIKEAIEKVDAFIEEDGLNESSRCFIGHNVSFDRRFLHAAWELEKKRFKGDLWLCTKKFMKSYVNKVGEDKIKKLQDEAKVKYGQGKCLQGVGLKPRYGAHSASIDCQDCLDLYSFLMDQNLNHVRVIENKPHNVGGSLIETYDY